MPIDTKIIEQELKLFRRLLISYNDFKQVVEIGHYISENVLHLQYPWENRILLQALNGTMIIAYCRPFSRKRRAQDALPVLPSRFLRVLTPEERDIHEVAIQDRNTILAHSDEAAWRMNPYVVKMDDNYILILAHASIRAPLLPEPCRILKNNSVKLM